MGMALTPKNAVGAMGRPGGEEARLARAREMGFDTDRTLYHGSIEPKPFDAFDLSHTGRNQGNDGFWGKGVYSTRERGVAKSYADYGGGPMAETYQPGHVRDLYSRAKKTFVVDHDNFADAQKLAAKVYPDAPLKTHGFLDPKDIEGWTKALKRHGYDSVEVKGRGVEHEWVDLDPRNLRDSKAAFDPAHSNSAGLLLSDQSKASLPGTVLNSMDQAQASTRAGAGLGHPDAVPGASEAARLARAREQGYDVDRPLYHGTSNTFDEFASGRRNIYLTDKPEIADIYAFARHEDGQRKHGNPTNAGPNVMPVYAKSQKPLVISDKGPDGSHGWVSDNLAAALGVENKGGAGGYRGLYDEARKQGYDIVEIKDMLDLGGPQSQFIPLSPANIRSKFADFNPADSDKSGLLLSKSDNPLGTGINALAEAQSSTRQQAKAPGAEPSITAILARILSHQ